MSNLFDMRIQRLTPELADQISAGEVIERPASVIKELVENSLDAGASRIQIEVKQGGHELLRVVDNGCGILKEDLELALSRHATSKITVLDDLEQVASLGFRGEALASMSAVSRLTLTSRHQSDSMAWSIGRREQAWVVQPAAHPIGTSMEVRDLFYNTPARRKFLRQPATEFSHIDMILQRLVLSRFNVAFQLTHNGRSLWQLPIADTPLAQEQRLERILGAECLQACRRIEGEAMGLRLTGWFACPELNRAQNDRQYFYLNGRFVRDKLVTHAVKEAYRDVLFHGRHPVYVLYLECDPRIVDVNVHPTKHEVRFRDSRSIHQFVCRTIEQALAAIRPGDTVPAIHSGDSQPIQVPLVPDVASAASSLLPSVNAWDSKTPMPVGQPALLQQARLAWGVAETPVMAESMVLPPLGHAIAQLHDIYILAQNSHGLILVDMHAAHERLLYEAMKQELASGGIVQQALLLPVTVTLNTLMMDIWRQEQTALAEVGLETAELGPQTVVIRSLPALLAAADAAQLLNNVLLDRGDTDSASHHVMVANHRLLGSLACRAAVHAKRRLTLVEMETILRDMEKCPHGGLCNHGRPTWTQLSFKQLDAFFLRGR